MTWPPASARRISIRMWWGSSPIPRPSPQQSWRGEVMQRRPSRHEVTGVSCWHCYKWRDSWRSTPARGLNPRLGKETPMGYLATRDPIANPLLLCRGLAQGRGFSGDMAVGGAGVALQPVLLDELLDQLAGLVVSVLHRGRLHEIG